MSVASLCVDTGTCEWVCAEVKLQAQECGGDIKQLKLC